jgi:hypothetical protein
MAGRGDLTPQLAESTGSLAERGRLSRLHVDHRAEWGDLTPYTIENSSTLDGDDLTDRGCSSWQTH